MRIRQTSVILNRIAKKCIQFVCYDTLLGAFLLLQSLFFAHTAQAEPGFITPELLFEVHVVSYDPVTMASHAYWKIQVLSSAMFFATYESPDGRFRERSIGTIDRKTMASLQTLFTRKPVDFSLKNGIPVYKYNPENSKTKPPREIERLHTAAYASQIDAGGISGASH